MSESKQRLQRENEELLTTKKNYEVLVAAARKALLQLKTLRDREVGTKTLEDAVALMPPPPPVYRPPPESIEDRVERAYNRRAAGLAMAAGAISGGLNMPHFQEHVESGLPGRGRR